MTSSACSWRWLGDVYKRQVERISHLVSILKALEILLPGPARADQWLRRPNAWFDDRSAIAVMLDGGLADIYNVRVYLDAQRGG